ncbi:DUF3303 family protein [Kitasatospora viridis]|uniref:DUF3303 domain-containing protein n=1 Tax=Kitasatospora viridis TaxID=281105 RepID=A0A561T7B5_9ACTN|nr:DUF3303 family protein [Kitasatospora viridis]TWF82999.1 hypothetical protein FHX73_14482 [Kitasatospora viridis]
MLWYCAYQALPQVRSTDLARRFLQRHDAGSNQPAFLRGWYTFPTGSAGFVLIEVDTPKELAAILDPYSTMVEWRVEAVSEFNYNQVLEELRRNARRAAEEDLKAGIPPEVVAGLLAR